MKGFEFPDSSDSEEKTIPELDNISTENTTSPSEDNYYSSDTNEFAEENFNPYEETVINRNPYQNAKIEDVITTEEKEEENEEEENEPVPPKVEVPVPEKKTPERQLTDDELTDLEIERIKAERSQKIKNMRGVFVIFMVVVIVTIAVAFNRTDKSKEKIVIDPIDIHTQDKDKDKVDFLAELNNYYQTKEKANVEKYLVDSASDSEKLQAINEVAVSQINKLLDDTIENATDSLDYDSKMRSLNEYITSLNNIRFNEAKVLKDTDYNSILEKIDRLKEQSTDYFNGLNYYNSKDYNNAINTFNAIPEDNYFKKAANNRIEKITGEVIQMLNADIANLSTNLEFLDEAQQKEKYLQIKSIIEQYNKAYPYLHLETNQTYNDLLNKYTELSN